MSINENYFSFLLTHSLTSQNNVAKRVCYGVFCQISHKEIYLKEIAIYGKGGIGKSTLSANICAALSLHNKKILQIGCDPKHDSTRLLMHGRRINTVLDYIKKTSIANYNISDILFEGFNDIGCIEAGGPKPGVGCAGRGIITAFEFLEKFHIKQDYDLIIYDVLGDVVCGGFAVPIRREYSDIIFIVTSGEYMSLYAANNILRGIKNYDQNKSRIAGILYNSRKIKDEDIRVKSFAKAVNLPIFAKIPRDDIFAIAEKKSLTVVEMQRNLGGEIYDIFSSIAQRLLDKMPLYNSNPLTDEELENLIFYGEKIVRTSKNIDSIDSQNLVLKTVDKNNKFEAGYISKNVLRDEPLHGCAFNGAMSMSVHIKDTVIIAHSPRSCSYLSYQSVSSSGRRNLFERGSLLPIAIVPNIVSTDMDESDMIFGGMDSLLDTVKKVQDFTPSPKAVIIISSCPSGIIGDDIEKAKELSTESCSVVTIEADGNLKGDYLQGMLMAYTQLAKQIIDSKVKPKSDVVNIVFEKVVTKNTESNFKIIKNILDIMDIKVNCRFLYNTSYDSLKNFCIAGINLLAYRDYTGKILEDFFIQEYGCKFYDKQFPIGFYETKEWIKGIAEIFNKQDIVEDLLKQNQLLYNNRVGKIRKYLEEKKLMIITYNHQIDWIIQTAIDVGMEIVKIGILNFSQDEGFRSNVDGISAINVEEKYNPTNRVSDIEKYKPDIVISNYETLINGGNYVVDTIPMSPDIGFFSGIIMAERWKDLFNVRSEGEWKNDKYLFDRHYSR